MGMTKSTYGVRYAGLGGLAISSVYRSHQEIVASFREKSEPYMCASFEVDFEAESPFRCFRGANFIGGMCKVDVEYAGTNVAGFRAVLETMYDQKWEIDELLEKRRAPHLTVKVSPLRWHTKVDGGIVHDSLTFVFDPDSSLSHGVFYRSFKKIDPSKDYVQPEIPELDAGELVSHVLERLLLKGRKMGRREIDLFQTAKEVESGERGF